MTVTVNRTLRLDPVTDRAVKIYAGRHGLSVTEAIRLLLEAELRREGCMDEARRYLKEIPLTPEKEPV